MTVVIIVLLMLAAIVGLGAVAGKRRRIVGSPADQRKAERHAAGTMNRIAGRGGFDGDPGSAG